MKDIISIQGENISERNSSSNLFFDNLIWLSTEEAAEYLRVSIGSIKNLVYRGVLKPRKLGRLNRFKREEIDRLLETSCNLGGA